MADVTFMIKQGMNKSTECSSVYYLLLGFIVGQDTCWILMSILYEKKGLTLKFFRKSIFNISTTSITVVVLIFAEFFDCHSVWE